MVTLVVNHPLRKPYCLFVRKLGHSSLFNTTHSTTFENVGITMKANLVFWIYLSIMADENWPWARDLFVMITRVSHQFLQDLLI